MGRLRLMKRAEWGNCDYASMILVFLNCADICGLTSLKGK